MELGQHRVKEEDIVRLALSLTEDLITDFPSLTKEDIRQSFRNGVRQTDIFLLSVKTYYKWIKTHQDLIWQNEKTEPIMQDKRLRYRTRQGTGMIELKNTKLIKQQSNGRN